MQQFPIIETKLIPPMVKSSFIRRPSLMKTLKQANNYPLTIIYSGAGYGKSTALSLFVADSNKKYCWYTITANDDDIIPFIQYIVHSIRKRFNSFGEELIPFMSSFSKVARDHELNLLNSIFIKELAALPDETTIIIDDYHLVDHSFSINHWLEKVIELLPEHIHLIISSRSKPKWPLYTKWKVAGKLLEIDESHLILNLEETDILFQDFYNISLNHRELVSIYRLTEGWVIALSMIAEQLNKGTSMESIVQYQHSSMDDLFQYLAMEVFTKHTPIIQSFIEQVSALEEITPALCDEILGINGSEAILEQLVEQNSFINKLNGTKQYRFHALFKAAVERRFKENNESLYETINVKSARHYEQMGLWDEALIHYEKIQYYDHIASLLEHSSSSMINSGKLESLMDRIKKLPRETKDVYKSLWFYEGEVQRYLSYYEKAKQCYQHLIQLCKNSQDWLLTGKAYEGIAQIYIDTIQPGIAERYLHLAIETFEANSGKNNTDIQHLYILRLENLVNSGQAKKAEKWLKKESLSRELLAQNNLDARLYLRTGNLEKAKEILTERILEQSRSLPQTHRETELLLSFIETCLGNGQEAKQYAQKGIEQGIKYKNQFVEACGWMRLGHSGQLTQSYDLKLTEECYLTSLNLMEKILVPRGKAEPYMGLCILYSKKSEYELSLKCGQMALFETEKVHDLWLSSYIRLSMGIASYNCSRFDEAKRYINDALDSFSQCGDQYGYTLSQLWCAFLSYQNEDFNNFKKHMSIFLQEMQLGSYDYIFYKHTPFGPKDLQSFIPILLKAKEMDIYISFVHSILQGFGLDDLDSHPGYTLKVRTFGSFQVYLGDQLVSDKDWQRIKAKELFQYLLVFKDRWNSKEEIYDELWPDADEKNIDQEFKVILNSCNKALEPKRKARMTPFYIQRQNHTYRINPKAVIDVDFEQFEHWVQQGLLENDPEKSKIFLLKGLELYKGDFLASKIDIIKINLQRDHLRTLFLRGAIKLAQLYVQLNQTYDAIYWCEKIIGMDHTWEEAYRLLMYCHYKKNNRVLALKYFSQCKEILNKEFGVEPMEATIQMYEMIKYNEAD